MGKIFYIMGKSSSGKDSVYRQLEADQELGLKRLVIYTTRPIRDGEENGRESADISDLSGFPGRFSCRGAEGWNALPCVRFPGSSTPENAFQEPFH